MKKTFFCAAMLLGAVLSAGQKIILEQNFDQDFKVGQTGMSGVCTGGKWVNTSEIQNFSIVSDVASSAPNALKILRVGGSGYFGISPDTKIPAGHNYGIDFDVYMPTGFGTVLHISNDKGLVGGLCVKSNAVPKAYNINQGWVFDNDLPETLPNAWYHVRVNFNVNRGFYTLDITYPDGKTAKGKVEYPLLNPEPAALWRFVNILPQGCHAYVDNVVISYDTVVSLDARDNFALTANSRNAKFDAMLKGKGSYIPDGKPVEIELNQAKFELLTFTAPLGKKLPASVDVRAQNAGGRWIEAGKMDIDPETGCVFLEEADQILKLQLTFPAVAGTALSAVGIYSAPGTPQGELDRAWAKKIDAEYRLPVYDRVYAGCDLAQLTFVNHTGKPLDAKIVLHERLKNRHYRTINHIIAEGTTHLELDTRDMPDGEYVTHIIDNSQKTGGEIRRLLRLYTSPECTAVPQTEMTGEKIFFPDGFFLAKSNNIRYTTGVANPILIKQGSTDDDSWIHYADNIGFNKDGKVTVNYRTMDRMWMTASTKRYHAVAENKDMTQWSFHEGSASLKSPNVLDAPLPEAAKPDWDPKKGADGKIKYRFYDPEKDGPIQINQLQCKFISYAVKGQLGYDDNNWGVMTPVAATVWTLWNKAPGETLIVGKHPLVSGFPGSGELEPPNSGSDLGFGQWLSDDGKTLYFGFGRHLMRYEPYIAPYDNLHDRARIVGIWRTTDGINWDQGYVAPPDTGKPVADQHYGGGAKRMPHGAGLYYCILYRYNALTQQISWEIIYSWDGFKWVRFQDQPQFMENGPQGSWNHGGGYIAHNALEIDGKYYMMMYYVGGTYHFEAEVLHSSTKSIDHIDAEYMRKRYEPRQLHRWPLFAKYYDNSWEKLAEHTKSARRALGILEYRKDGFFYAVADDKDAEMLTHPVCAKNSMKINAVVKDGGYLKVALVDEQGQEIPGYAKEYGQLDNTDLVVFDQLPEGKFQVRLNLKNTEVYTLSF